MNRAVSRKRVTLADVAALAGVSRAAASVALSPRPSTTVLRPETRARILEVARELSYKPDIQAKGLITSRSFLVALLARNAFGRWTVGVSRGIEQEIRERSYSLLSYTYGDRVADEDEHLRLSLDRHVDGLIVMPSLDPDGKTNAHQFASLRRERMPIVQLFGKVLEGIPSVLRGHTEGTRMAVEHLLSLGHRRIAHLTHDRSNAAGDPINAHCDARLVREAYEAQMREAGLSPVVLTHPVPNDGGFQFAEEGERMAGRLLDLNPRPTAVVTYADLQALGLMRGLHRRGVRIPEHISVVGSDNEEASRVSYPSLTSVSYSEDALGQAAGKLLLAQMDGEAPGDSVIAPSFCARESSGPAPLDVSL